MNLYKTDSLHRFVTRTKDGKPNGYTQYNTPAQYEFDLRNINQYDESGKLIKEESGGKYDLKFADVAGHLKPIEKLTDFLEYQYANTERPDAFLKHIVTRGVLGLKYLAASPERQSIIVKWVQEKQKEIKSMPTATPIVKTKLKWLGNQKQLAELLITLEQNNWIEKIQDGDRAAICRTICDLIDITATKNSEKSNEVKSFTEIMKPDTDGKKNITYPKIFTPRLKPKFKGILPR